MRNYRKEKILQNQRNLILQDLRLNQPSLLTAGWNCWALTLESTWPECQLCLGLVTSGLQFPYTWNGANKASFTGLLRWSVEISHDKHPAVYHHQNIVVWELPRQDTRISCNWRKWLCSYHHCVLAIVNYVHQYCSKASQGQWKDRWIEECT